MTHENYMKSKFSVNKILLQCSHTCLPTVCGSLHASIARVEDSWQRLYALQNLRYLLPVLLQKKFVLNIHLPYDSAMLFLRIYPRKTKIYIHKKLYANICSGFIHNCLKPETPSCPSAGQWINKLWYIHMMKFYLTIKGQRVNILHFVGFPMFI